MNAEAIQIITLTLTVCTISTLVGGVIGLPLGLWLGFSESRISRYLKPFFTAMTGLPPVIAGVLVFMALSNQGPFGHWRWLYTSNAIVVAQILIVTPIIIAFSFPVYENIRDLFTETTMGLRLRWPMRMRLLFLQCKEGILTALLSGFGRAIAEVGAVMMVGGNIQYKTRVMTTAIVLETSKGNYEQALLLGGVLMVIALLVNYGVQLMKGRSND